MILDLNPLPYKIAMDLVRWCCERDIDRVKCLELAELWGTPVSQWPDGIEWTLDIPDKYITFFLIKWSGLLSVSQTQ